MKRSTVNPLSSILFFSLLTLLFTSLISCTPKKTEPFDEPTTKPAPVDPDPTITTHFDVTKTVAGTLNNYSIQLQMSFETEHVKMAGGRFLVIEQNGVLSACANPCSSNYWLQWDPSVTYIDWTMNGLLSKVGSLENGSNSGELREIFSYQGDVSSLVGVKVYAGYGLGSTSAEAVNEMLNAKRYKLVHTIQ